MINERGPRLPVEFDARRLENKDYICGPFSLRLVYDKLGLDYPLERIIKDTKADRYKGTNWIDLIKHVTQRGFLREIYCETSTYRDLLRSWANENQLIIGMMWRHRGKTYSHFAAVNSISRNTIVLAHPDFGKTTRTNLVPYSRENFVKVWRDSEVRKGFLEISRKPRTKR